MKCRMRAFTQRIRLGGPVIPTRTHRIVFSVLVSPWIPELRAPNQISEQRVVIRGFSGDYLVQGHVHAGNGFSGEKPPNVVRLDARARPIDTAEHGS